MELSVVWSHNFNHWYVTFGKRKPPKKITTHQSVSSRTWGRCGCVWFKSSPCSPRCGHHWGNFLLCTCSFYHFELVSSSKNNILFDRETLSATEQRTQNTTCMKNSIPPRRPQCAVNYARLSFQGYSCVVWNECCANTVAISGDISWNPSDLLC